MAIFRKWESRVAYFVYYQYKNPYIKLLFNSDGFISSEVKRTGTEAAPFLLLIFLNLLIFTVSTAWRPDPSLSKVWAGFFGVFGPIVATAGAFGAVTALGYAYQSIVSATLYLILAIGCDDVYLMLHSWRKCDKSLSTPERLGNTLSDCGPSITITSLTNGLSSAIGLFSGTPAIQTFSIYTTAAIVFSYFFQITVFTAILSFDSGKFAIDCQRKPWFDFKIPDFSKLWTKTVLNPVVRGLTITLTLVYWTVSIYGLIQMQVAIATDKVVMPDSPIIDFFQSMMKDVGTGMNQLSIFVNSPPDFRVKLNLELVKQMVKDFEWEENSFGQISTQFWLYPYLNYLDLFKTQSFTYGQIPSFLEMPEMKEWNARMLIEKHECLVNRASCIQAFMLTTGYTNVTSLTFKHKLLQIWRKIAENYSQFNVTIFEPAGYFADQISSIKSTTQTTLIISLCCMALVCVIFIQNLISIVFAAISVLSINIGVVGFLVLWDVQLDPIAMASILMSVGFSVDFTAHISYHFYKFNDESIFDGLNKSFESIAWPMIQASISTLLGGIVLFFHQSYMITVFIKTLTLVAVFGLFHGLLILPVTLAMAKEIEKF